MRLHERGHKTGCTCGFCKNKGNIAQAKKDRKDGKEAPEPTAESVTRALLDEAQQLTISNRYNQQSYKATVETWPEHGYYIRVYEPGAWGRAEDGIGPGPVIDQGWLKDMDARGWEIPPQSAPENIRNRELQRLAKSLSKQQPPPPAAAPTQTESHSTVDWGQRLQRLRQRRGEAPAAKVCGGCKRPLSTDPMVSRDPQHRAGHLCPHCGHVTPLNEQQTRRIIEHLLEDCFCACAKCGAQFDYCQQPESGMGYVACPSCSEPVTQDQCAQPDAAFGVQKDNPVDSVEQQRHLRAE